MEDSKEDMLKINKIIQDLCLEIHTLRFELMDLRLELEDIKASQKNTLGKNLSTFPALRQINPTDFSHKTSNPTHNYPLNALKTQNNLISTGNRGVPTDRQTDRQTDQHTRLIGIRPEIPSENPIERASEVLDSLDALKKEIRLKFKRLTSQEMLIFSTIYQLSEEKGYCDYKDLSVRLNLTESSIRDYVGRLIKKGIPVDKKKINNKYIQILISPNLKKIASLSTIISLREL